MRAQLYRHVREVQAVRLTRRNVEAVCEWVEGEEFFLLDHKRSQGVEFGSAATSSLNVQNAQFGQWIVKIGDSFEVWHNEDFKRQFKR